MSSVIDSLCLSASEGGELTHVTLLVLAKDKTSQLFRADPNKTNKRRQLTQSFQYQSQLLCGQLGPLSSFLTDIWLQRC